MMIWAMMIWAMMIWAAFRILEEKQNGSFPGGERTDFVVPSVNPPTR